MKLLDRIDRKRKRIKRTFLLRRNQQKIIKLINNGFDEIALHPIPFSGGVEHYYHFVFDFLLPIVTLFGKTGKDFKITVNYFGVLTPILKLLLKDNVKILDKNDLLPEKNKINLIGMNPTKVEVGFDQVNFLNHFVRRVLDIDFCEKPDKILLIERLPPNEYFLNEAIRKGSGASRRSIINHNELRGCLSEKIPEEYDFQNVQLEEMAFREQVRCFSRAKVVVAQHGAGLANIIWMNPQAVVFELGLDGNNLFKRISRIMGHEYFCENYSDPHIRIDCENFIKKLISILGSN